MTGGNILNFSAMGRIPHQVCQLFSAAFNCKETEPWSGGQPMPV